MERNNELETRYARIVPSEAVKAEIEAGNAVDERNITAVIAIGSTLPMVLLSTPIKQRHIVTDVDTQTPADDSETNTIYDPENPGRFTYVGEALSTISKLLVKFYYDAMFKDIIAVPDMLGVGTGDDSKIYENSLVVLNGHRVGSGIDTDVPIRDLTIGMDKADITPLPLPTKVAKTTVVTLTIPGIGNTSPNSIRRTLDADHDLITSKVNGLTQFIDIGSYADVFGDNPAGVPVYNVLQFSITGHGLDYIGRKKPSNIYIPLNF